MTLRLNGTTGYVELDSPAAGDSSLITLPSGGNGTLGRMQLATSQASTSGTFIDFTGIPSWVKRVTVMLNGVSTGGTSNLRIQLGTGGTPTTSGYTGSSSWTAAGSVANSLSAGFDINSNVSATTAIVGLVTFANVSGNIWVGSGAVGYTAGTASTQAVAGVVTLSGVLNMVRITTVSADTFDAGSINILYEG